MALSSQISAYEALAWQLDMGVDECIETAPQLAQFQVKAAAPVTGFAEPVMAPFDLGAEKDAIFASAMGEAAPAKKTIPKVAMPVAAMAPSLAAAIENARLAADAATDLNSLEAAVRAFNDCPLKRTATHTVFAQGVPESGVMFIGEAPGADEDRQGIPFCGASGQLLDKMLSFIGLKRSENFYITNTLFWRPPGNRQPTPEELAMCRPFVEKHIALVRPNMLILVGGTATQSILADTRGITRLRGQKFSYTNDYLQGEQVPVRVIYHPSYLLRQPMAKKQTWADLLAIKAALDA